MFRNYVPRLSRSVTFGLVALALIASAVAGGFAGQADAAPDHLILITYYSDASMTVEVGGRAVGCNGSTTRWGRTSPYPELYTEPCF